MMRTTFICRLFSMGLLAVGIANLSAHGQNARDKDEKQIKELEKHIAELESQLKALKEHEVLPAPKEVGVAEVPASWINPMQWRCIGPATMGGRITALAVVESDPTCYWVATASGGLLHTVNNGVTFEHQFDHEATVSLGAVAVAPSDKNIVWVGTGEANPRNSVSYGDGVYKSVDGGKTWKNMGLKDSFQIGKIVIHPTNPDIVYVGALGRLYGPNPERGLFKTTDGGKTWQKVLFVDDKTGVIDVAMHPSDPELLIVATWQRRRDEFDSFRGDAKKPDGTDEYAPMQVHAPGSGLYRSSDGGKTFAKLSNGLPAAKMGRIGLDFSRQHPDTIFAIIDTEKTGAGNASPVRANAAYLGVLGEDDPGGAQLTTVTEGSPAEKAGLKVGDIVVQFDAKEIKSYDDLLEALADKKPNDKVKTVVVRDKDRKEIEITLGSRGPANPKGKGGKGGQGGGPGNQDRPSLGIEVEETADGLFIADVVPKGPADKASLKADDVITQIDGMAVANQRALAQALMGKSAGDKVKITYVRDKQTKDVEATLEVIAGAPGRPNGDRSLGGQIANAQTWQGPEGVNTGGLFKSTDRGQSWTRINSINPRPFYFSLVRVDPTNDNIIFVGGIKLQRSTDGGKRFSPDKINAGLHDDQHAMWIDPHDSKHLLIGCDGGFYVSYDRAANWEHINRVALGQFYHVSVDSRVPYRVYGGLQDNGSWGGPSNTRKANGPTNDDWTYVNGGDGFYCQVDRDDPDRVYAESQDGRIMRRNLRTGASNFIRPLPQPGLSRYRFNWNTPFILSQHNPGIFYSGGNYVFRSVEQGNELKPISPEITRTKHGTATALAESPRSPDILWAGTDDGAVQVTRDGGRTWTDVSANFKSAGLPGPRWVASIEASRWKDGRAYVVFDAHRSDDDQPYVYVTEDFGKSWQSLRANLPIGSTRVLREDLHAADLLYLGAEFGIWASINRGQSWVKINGKSLPTVAVHEIAQPTTANEIVVATHGRSIWILDVSALRQMTPAVLRNNAPKLFNPSVAMRWQVQPGGNGPFQEANRRFVGTNPPRGATIDYLLPKKDARVALKIVDISNRTVAELKAENDAGLHRVVWNLQSAVQNRQRGKGGADPAGGNAFRGKGKGADPTGNAPPQSLFGSSAMGTYRVVLTVDGIEQSAPLIVEGDPNAPREAAAAVDEVEEERALRRLEKKQVEEDDDDDED
jgi:photosystem II stability/assembly factor-like uncharacterized protein